MTDIEILKSCFYSPSNSWQKFTLMDGNLNTLYYPSAGEDMIPFVLSKKEELNFLGLDLDNYIEPNFFIFSDYFPWSISSFFDSRYVPLHDGSNSFIFIEEYCQLFPTDKYKYRFNTNYVHFEPSRATGKAIFFKARIESPNVEKPYYRHGIYFFYENINLIEQLFLKNKMPFSHLVWKRDGSSLGGGNINLTFLDNISFLCKTKYFFLWDRYFNVQSKTLPIEAYRWLPFELSNYLSGDFQMSVTKKLKFPWGVGDINKKGEEYDYVNLYFKE